MADDELQQNDPVSLLKSFTSARIGIGRSGISVPVKESLAFNLAHAIARDAVYAELDIELLHKQLEQFNHLVLEVHSAAVNRSQYLQRPDLGRLLDVQSKTTLGQYAVLADIVIIIADGLSADAVNQHAADLLQLLIPKLIAAKLNIAPIILASQARVAIGDEAGEMLNARLSLILIGERPGLSAADSVGAYITYHPKKGLTDDSRNCVSNIRPQGLPLPAAADKIFYLINEALRIRLSGVMLKDNSGLLR